MHKEGLVRTVAEKVGVSQKQVDAVLQGILDVIQQTVAAGDKVTLIGFGTFESRERQAREGRNPQTGEPIQIPASKAPVFSAGKGFKDIVSNGEKSAA